MKSGRAFLCIVFIFAPALTCTAQAPGPSPPDPDALLRSLYKAHDARKGPFFDKENRSLLEQYFTEELADLIRKDAAAAAGEGSALDFDPLYDSQDPQITNFEIGKIKWGGSLQNTDNEPDDGAAAVEVTFEDSGQPRSIKFRFEQNTDKAWRIADIEYSDGRTIVGILSGNDDSGDDN